MKPTALLAAGGALAAAALTLCVLAVRPAHATSITPISPAQMTRQADLVFQGQVTDVTYRMSRGGPGLDALPHTFVTYRIDHLLKGRSRDGILITLRLQGGPVPGTQRAMAVAGAPNFDIGETDILFVRENGEAPVPLVGWGLGRYRVVNGLMFSDEGREIYLDRDNQPLPGKAHALTEVQHHQLGSVALTFPAPSDEQPWTAPSGARRASDADFRRALLLLIQRQARTSQANAVVEPSMNPAVAFAIPAAMAAPAPRATPTSIAVLQGIPNPMEQRLVEDGLRRLAQPPVHAVKRP